MKFNKLLFVLALSCIAFACSKDLGQDEDMIVGKQTTEVDYSFTADGEVVYGERPEYIGPLEPNGDIPKNSFMYVVNFRHSWEEKCNRYCSNVVSTSSACQTGLQNCLHGLLERDVVCYKECKAAICWG